MSSLSDVARERGATYRASGEWRDRTVFHSAQENAHRTPDRPAFLGEHPLTFSAAILQAEALAASLWELGLRPGDTLAFQLPNWEESAVINLAACRLGLQVCPLVPIYREAELGFMLRDSDARVLFVPSIFRGYDYLSLAARLGIEGLRVVSVRAPDAAGPTYEQLVSSGVGAPIPVSAPSPDDLKLRIYTSGTTGTPKAVLHNHNTLVGAIDNCAAKWAIGRDDVVLMPSPVTHVTGYGNGIEFPFYYGAQSVLMDRWDVDNAVDLIDRWGATFTVGATPFLQELTAAAERRGKDLPSLRLFACGGAAVDPTVIERANAVFSAKPAVRVYGSSEAPLVSIGVPGNGRDDAAARTDGEIMGYEARILDAGGTEVADGIEGELVVRGAPLFLGYAKQSDNVGAFTAGGFFRTGDLAVIERGALTITGRKKDLIIRGGENLSPREIELVIAEHPAVEEVAVVAMPHERLGEGVCACVILKAGRNLDFTSLCAFVREAGLSKQKTPERLEVLSNFPRTASGKIKKDELRKMVASNRPTISALINHV